MNPSNHQALPEAFATVVTAPEDTIVVLPSADDGAVELLAARVGGPVRQVRARRDGAGLAGPARLIWQFLQRRERPAVESTNALAPLVFSWLAGRGIRATRVDPSDMTSARELQQRIAVLLRDRQLFSERIVVLKSGFRPTSTRP